MRIYLLGVANTYHFGYQVNPDGNFHHERRDQEGVTYGCYGYINSSGKLFVTHYVADRRGYRVVEPNKPLYVYLTDRISWQAFLLPKGCGRPSASNSNQPGPELIYKPQSAVSTTTKRPTTTNSMSTTTRNPSPVCPCSQTTTKKPSPATVLTPKPPSTTTMRSTTVSKTTPSTTSYTSTTPIPSTLPPSKPVPTLIDVDADVNILNLPKSNVSTSDDFINDKAHSETNATAPYFYYVPYKHHLAPPPGVPSTAPPGSCNSHYGHLGLAPVIFVPINAAKSLGLVAEADGIPLRMFANDSGGNLTLTEVLDEEGTVIKLDYSNNVFQGIVNGGDFDSLKYANKL
ncbi:AAEL003616-PA [Aedes aegypti]|uniref:AAEL003616-PA n=1 Tax=Aedes aegypti TaxID=7159 RepID=Q17F03_AEDAE|nr:AAEL003616-PA [Aedes aegypti]